MTTVTESAHIFPCWRHAPKGFQLSGYLTTYGIRQPSIVERKLLRRLGYAGIYFVGWEGDEESDPIKIGIAVDPFQRFASLQCGNWRRLKVLELLHVKSSPDLKDFKVLSKSEDGRVVIKSYDKYGEGYFPVVDIEAAVHRELKGQGFHYSGEWFQASRPHLIQFVKDAIVKGFNHSYLTHSSMLRQLKLWKEAAEAA